VETIILRLKEHVIEEVDFGSIIRRYHTLAKALIVRMDEAVGEFLRVCIKLLMD
jgi:hypothetical protein